MHDSSRFIRRLLSSGPAPDRANDMRLYSWLIGDWRFDATIYRDDGTEYQGRGEIHFVWALEGRAIQDVWILPGIFYGTTLRVYDPALGRWHILWSDPLRQVYTRQLGRADGREIVQEGQSDKGVPLRWRFVDITPNAFRWLGERSLDGCSSWQLQADFQARRESNEAAHV